MQQILANHARTRRPDGCHHGAFAIPGLRSRVAILREKARSRVGCRCLRIIDWRNRYPHCIDKDAKRSAWIWLSVRVIGSLIIPFMGFAFVTVKARLPPRRGIFWIPSAYKNTKYILLIVSLFFIFIGMFTPLFYLPTYAVAQGMSPSLAGYLLAILNAASTFGRIIPGILANRYGRLNIFSIGEIVAGIVIFCMSSASSDAVLIVYAIVFGFVSGTIISSASAALSLFSENLQDVGTYMGIGMSISAPGGLIGPPVNGALVKTYGGFFEVSMFSGTMCVLGGCIALAAKVTNSSGVFSTTYGGSTF